MPADDAKVLHARGREAGARGDYGEALRLLTDAAARAPDWPQPIYDRAYTRLLMKEFDDALADYERTLILAPRGFFTAHVAVDVLRREQRGEFPRGLYFAYTTLEHMEEPQKRDLLRQLVEKFPSLAPAWLAFANLADDPQERLRRIQAGLAATPDPETHGMLRLNQALVFQQLGQQAAAEAIFKELVSSPTTTAAVEAWAKVMLTKK